MTCSSGCRLEKNGIVDVISGEIRCEVDVIVVVLVVVLVVGCKYCTT